MEERRPISVVIPTFNRATLIGATIDSVLPQLAERDELIVVDDGSTDNTREVVSGYGARIRYVWQRNGFLAAARNEGQKAARGDFVLFLDSDDLLLESALGRLHGMLVAQPECVLAYGAARGFNSAGPQALAPLHDKNDRPATVRLASANFIRTAGCALVRKAALDAAGPWDRDLRGIEDWDMWLRLSLIGPFAHTSEPTLLYRVHDSNMSSDSGMMDASYRKFVFKHSDRGAGVRQNNEAWTLLRKQRLWFLRDDLAQAVRGYPKGQISLIGLAGAVRRYVGTPDGAWSACNDLARGLLPKKR